MGNRNWSSDSVDDLVWDAMPGGNCLANIGYAGNVGVYRTYKGIPTVVDNHAGDYMYGDVYINLHHARYSGAIRSVSLYMFPSLDGTNFPPCGSYGEGMQYPYDNIPDHDDWWNPSHMVQQQNNLIAVSYYSFWRFSRILLPPCHLRFGFDFYAVNPDTYIDVFLHKYNLSDSE